MNGYSSHIPKPMNSLAAIFYYCRTVRDILRRLASHPNNTMRDFFLATMLSAMSAGVSAQTMCSRPIDLVMILDESGSVSNNEWSEARTFMAQIAARYTVGQGATDTRISVVPFSGRTQQKTVIKFNQGTSNSKIAELISGMQRSYWSGTCTGKSMLYTDDNVIASSGVSITNGYRNMGTNGEVSTVVVFLTDGNPSGCVFPPPPPPPPPPPSPST